LAAVVAHSVIHHSHYHWLEALEKLPPLVAALGLELLALALALVLWRLAESAPHLLAFVVLGLPAPG
jgi:hypothetical protein